MLRRATMISLLFMRRMSAANVAGQFEIHEIGSLSAYSSTRARRLHALAPGLTPRSVLKKFATVQMIDVHLPTTDWP
jgi:hypothetical protein